MVKSYSQLTQDQSSPPLNVGFAAALVFTFFGAWIVVMTPIIVTLSIRVAQLDPAGKTADLSLILGTGAFISTMAMPIWGLLSDRTVSRWGRRRPWIAASAILSTLAFSAISLASHVSQILVGWCAATLTLTMGQAAMLACIPDLIPDQYRGRVSALVGLTFPLALVSGTFLADILAAHLAVLFLAPLAFLISGSAWLLATIPDPPVTHATSDPISLTNLAGAFWVNPFRHRDFGLCWLNRFLVILGYAVFLSYQTYYLMDHLQVPGTDAPRMIFLATALCSAATVVACITAGWLSDRSGRRKPFVAGAVAIMAVGLLILGTGSTHTLFYVGATLTGLGEGLYFAVDLALVSAVLPDQLNSGKYMAVMNLASVLPQSVAPAIAPIFLAVGGGANYSALFMAATVFALLGAMAVVPIRSSR